MSEQNTVYDVVGIGNAIVDVLAKVGDTFLKERDLTKGCMTLVEAAEAGFIMTLFLNAKFLAALLPIPWLEWPLWALTALLSEKYMMMNWDKFLNAISVPPALIALLLRWKKDRPQGAVLFL